MTVKSWRDAETYEDLYACGIRGFLDFDNANLPEAEVVATVKEAMERIEAGDFEIVADIGDNKPFAD